MPLRVVVTLLLLVAWASSVWAEICPGNQENVSRLRRYDREIFLSVAEIEESEATHLRFGRPACARYLFQRESVVCYDQEQRVGLWAIYRLRRGDLVSRERRNSFRTDPRLTVEETARCRDYRSSGWDRGHGVAREDMNRTFRAQSYTFYLSNMTPQAAELNQGLWRWLEEAVRAWARKFREVHVMTGAVFDSQSPRHVPSGRVGIPDRYYKIVLRMEGGGLVSLAIMLPNQEQGLPLPPGTPRPGPKVSAEEADAFLAQHLVSIEAVEQATGLDFLPALLGATKEALRRAVASELWPRN